jgi:hypothetical protein
MTLESPADFVIYRSRLNAKINRNFEVFTPTDFLAAITQMVTTTTSQMVITLILQLTSLRSGAPQTIQ